MPYFIYCKRCNENGSYLSVKEDCPKCEGGGKDWREDNELSDYHSWSGLSLEKLITEKSLIAEDGTEFFYRNDFTTLEQDLIYVKNTKIIHHYKTLPKLKEKYEYYIEPCQLCISRGEHNQNCGWCGEDDTFGGESKEHIGNLTKIPHGGWGYPFHELPHPERKYFTKSGEHFKNYNGYLPSEINNENIKEAVWRNTHANQFFDLIQDGSCFANRTIEIKKEHIDDFLELFQEMNNLNLNSHSLYEITGKVEFAFLNYSIYGLEQQDMSKLMSIKFLIEKNLIDQLIQLLKNDSKQKHLLEVVFHESFHIFQAISFKSLAIRFEAERRLSVLKWILFEDYFIKRTMTVEYGTNIYSLLHKIDENSDYFQKITRLFDYSRADIQLILKYTKNHSMVNLNLFDLIEGSAYVFQKYFVEDEDLEIHFENNLPDIYKNAWNYFKEHRGSSSLEFLLFIHQSFRFGIILDEDDISNSTYSPLTLFYYLCSLKKEDQNFLHIDLSMINTIEKIQSVLISLDFSEEMILNISNRKEFKELKYLLEIILNFKKLETEIFTFLKHVGINESEYRNLKEISDNLDKVRKGQANERILSVKEKLLNKYPLLTEDILFPMILSFKQDFYKMFFDISKEVNETTYIGGFGDKEISTEYENNMMDIINRIEDCIVCRKAFCCEEHGKQEIKNIAKCQNENGLNKIMQKQFNKSIFDFIEWREK